MSQLRFTLSAPLLAVAAACATPAPPVENVRRGMLPDSREKIASTEVVLPIQQKDIYVYTYIAPQPNTVYYSSGGGIAGAIGVALGSAIGEAMIVGQNNATRQAAEETAKPVRAALAGFSFDETLQADVKAAVAQMSWLKPGDGYRVIKEVAPGRLEKALGAPTASGRLLVTADYQLSQNADELIISVAPFYYYQERTGAPAAVIPVSADGQPASGTAPASSWTDHLFYKNIFYFRMKAPNASTNPKNNACEWAYDNGAVMRSALRMGSAKLTQLLVADLQDAPVASPLPIAAKEAAIEEVTVGGVKGIVVARDEQGAFVNLESGAKAFLATPPGPAYTLAADAKPPCGPLPKPAVAKPPAAKPAPKAKAKRGA